MPFRHLCAALIAAFALIATPALAQEAETAPRDESTAPGGFRLGLLPADATTRHVLKTASGEIRYTATAGTLDLVAPDGRINAKIFYTSYVAEEADSRRPLTFAFNGGPGAASAYLHLGLAGPRVLDFGPNANDGTTPELGDNPDSWLAFTDLVFIDPVGTGWSRAADDSTARRYFGVNQDAEALAKAIALYVQNNNRISSPKYLLGESYGGFRAGKVAAALKDSQSILVSGIVMVSPMIEANLIFGGSSHPVGAAVQLPSIVAAEIERRGSFSPEKVAEAEKFAMTDYLVALAGPEPAGAAAERLYQKIAELTGIPKDLVARRRGFVGEIYEEAVAGKIVSVYDAAITAPDPFPETGRIGAEDPVLDGYTRAYGAAFASYARNELNYPCGLTYMLLNTEVNRRWEWGEGGRYQAGASNEIRSLLASIPEFRLLIVHGYSDVITPFGASRYVIDHIPRALSEGRVELKLYRGGHMFYTEPASRSEMSRDAARFYRKDPA